MNIQCPKCQTNYNVNITPEEISEKGRKFSCQNCKNQFFVRKKQGSSFISLMENIKDKLDDWDSNTEGNGVNENEKGTHDENQQKDAEYPSEVADEKVDELLQDILDKDEEESEEKAQLMPEQLPSATADTEKSESETESEPVAPNHGDIDKMLEEALPRELGEIVQEPVEDVADIEKSEPESETKSEPVASNQEDIDKMLEEALPGEPGETVQEPVETTADTEKSEPEAETEAETESEPVASNQEDIDKMLEEAVSGQPGETVQEEPVEAVADTEKSEPEAEPATSSNQEDIDRLFKDTVSGQPGETVQEPVEATADIEKSESEAEPEASDQEDIDRLFKDAVSQQLDGTLQDSVEATAEKESPSSLEESASEPEAAGQGDIDKLFEEAVSQKRDGTLQDSVETSTEEQSSDIDSLWASALEEASGTEQSDSADSDKEKADESYAVDGDQFQSDLENLLESVNESDGVSTGEADKEPETQTLEAPAPAVSDDVDETIAESQNKTTAVEMPASEGELSEEKGMDEDSYEEDAETNVDIISESEQEPLKEKILFYKDMVIFFLTDKKKVVKFLVPAFIAISLMSGGGYWYLSTQGDSEITVARVDEKEIAKIDKKTETLEPIPGKETKEAAIPKPFPIKESKPDDQITVAKKEKTQGKETKQNIIPGADIPVSKGRIMSISIGSIVPVVFSQGETRVMSLNVKLNIDNQKVYEQVKRGLPLFEDKVESTIEKYFEGKFYKDIQFVQKKLGEELQNQLNKEVKGGRIKTVELEDFLIQ